MFLILLTPSGAARPTLRAAAVLMFLLALVFGLALLWVSVFLIAIAAVTVLCAILCAIGAGSMARTYALSLPIAAVRALLRLAPFAALGGGLVFYADTVMNLDRNTVERDLPWLWPGGIAAAGLAAVFAAQSCLRNCACAVHGARAGRRAQASVRTPPPVRTAGRSSTEMRSRF